MKAALLTCDSSLNHRCRLWATSEASLRRRASYALQSLLTDSWAVLWALDSCSCHLSVDVSLQPSADGQYATGFSTAALQCSEIRSKLEVSGIRSLAPASIVCPTILVSIQSLFFDSRCYAITLKIIIMGWCIQIASDSLKSVFSSNSNWPIIFIMVASADELLKIPLKLHYRYYLCSFESYSRHHDQCLARCSVQV